MRLFDPKRAKVKAIVSEGEAAKPEKQDPKPAPAQPNPTDWPTLWKQLLESLSMIANKILARQESLSVKRTSEFEQATDALIKTVKEVGKSRKPTAWTVEVLKSDRNGNPTKLRLTPDVS
jgi:hypothetical protein